MKNRIDKSRARKKPENTPEVEELAVKIRIKSERLPEFLRNAQRLGLTRAEYASAIIEVNMEGDRCNSFEQIGYFAMFAATDLYPEREEALRPMLDAMVAFSDSEIAIQDARKMVVRELLRVAPEEIDPFELAYARSMSTDEAKKLVRERLK